jgi:hypothetical protein
VVAINFSGGFSCAVTATAHKAIIIMQIFGDCRNLSSLEMPLVGPWMSIALEFIKRGPYFTLTRARQRR